MVWHDGSLVAVAANTSRAVEDGGASVGVVAHLDLGLDEMSRDRAFGDLQLEAVERQTFVMADHAIFLDAGDLVQIDARNGDKGRLLLLRDNRETGIVGGNIDVALVQV